MSVSVLVLSDWSGIDAYARAGFGWSNTFERRTGGATEAGKSSVEEISNGLRDIVGSVSTPDRVSLDPAIASGIGNFSFCDLTVDSNGSPFAPAGGFGGEARLREQWTAELEAFRYDLGHTDLLAWPLSDDIPVRPLPRANGPIAKKAKGG